MRPSRNNFGDLQAALLNAFACAVDSVRFPKWLHDGVLKLLSNPPCEFYWSESRKDILTEFEEDALRTAQVGLDEGKIVALP